MSSYHPRELAFFTKRPKVPKALSGLSTADLESLLKAVDRGDVECPVTQVGLLARLGSRAVQAAQALAGADRAGVEAALRIAVAERVHGAPPRLELVWIGPEASSSATRDTSVVVRRLFERARESVIVGGYSYDHGEELFRSLYEGMKSHGVRAAFFLDIDGHADYPSGAHEYAHAQIDAFFIENWPFGQPRPDVYYDARTAVKGPPWASLHAKCVVVDQRYALIGSANFTQRGHERNVEAGVLIDDEDFACRLVAQWRSLIDSGAMTRYRG